MGTIITRTMDLLVFIVLCSVYGACAQTCAAVMNDKTLYNNITFQKSGEHFINPGRGFYHRSLTYSSDKDFTPLQSNLLDCWRNTYGISLLLRQYVLEDFVNTTLTQLFLDKLDVDLDTVYTAGWNAILRFMYNQDTDLKYNHSHEPDIAGILDHITQLGPIFERHKNIIIAIQAGFLGEYGVWYEPEQANSSEPPLNAQSKILSKLLDIVPYPIQIQVPKPTYKQVLFSQVTVNFDTRTNTNVSRIGHYHECLLEGNNTNKFKDAYPDLSHNTNDLDYLSKDTVYTLMGGKTCHPGHLVAGTRDLCDESRRLFEKIHMSYLDGRDSDLVMDEYRTNGCYETIHDKLGYHFLLNYAIIPRHAKVNSDICVEVSLSNTGYSSTYRDLDLFLVFMLNKTIVYRVNMMTRTKLFPPTLLPLLTTTKAVSLRNMETGVYQVYLGIADKFTQNRTDYFVLIPSSLNGNPISDPRLGLNHIGNISITAPGSGNTYLLSNSWEKLQTMKLPVPGNHSRKWTPKGSTTSCIQLPSHPPVSNAPINFTAFATCNKFEVVKALLMNDHFKHPSASPCSDGNRYSSAAILNLYCKAPPATQWQPLSGSVINNCEKISMYTPIAEFGSNSKFDTSNGLSGVFLGCGHSTSGIRGIKIGYQTCNKLFDVRFISLRNAVLNDLHIIHW